MFKFLFKKRILYQIRVIITEGKYDSISKIYLFYLLSKTNLSNKTDMFISTAWNILRPMYKKDKKSQGSKVNHHLFLLQHIKANYF